MFLLLILFSTTDAFAVSSVLSQNTLNVIWWNIACFKGESTASPQDGLLNSEIRQLVLKESQNDVLIFGEYCPGREKPELTKFLNQNYSHHAWVPYKPGAGIGIGVFSKVPFSQTTPINLDWVPLDGTTVTQERYRTYWLMNESLSSMFERPYSVFTLEKNGQLFEVIPLHILNPWRHYQSLESSDFAGKKRVVSELLFGTDNPNYYQTRRLMNQLRADFGQKAKTKLVAIGDFNFPRSVLFETQGHKLVSNYLNNIMSTNEWTQADHKIKIDHAFASSAIRVRAAKVLKYQGSDHRAILVEVQ